MSSLVHLLCLLSLATRNQPFLSSVTTLFIVSTFSSLLLSFISMRTVNHLIEWKKSEWITHLQIILENYTLQTYNLIMVFGIHCRHLFSLSLFTAIALIIMNWIDISPLITVYYWLLMKNYGIFFSRISFGKYSAHPREFSTSNLNAIRI